MQLELIGGAVVTLLSNNIEEKITVNYGQNIVINMNGATLTSQTGIVVQNYGVLQIRGNGSIEGTGNSSPTILNYASTLKLKDIQVSSEAGTTIQNGNWQIGGNPKLLMSNISITSNTNVSTVLMWRGNCKISGGTIQSSNKVCIEGNANNNNEGTIEINNCTLEGNTYAIYLGGYNFKISGGNITANVPFNFIDGRTPKVEFSNGVRVIATGNIIAGSGSSYHQFTISGNDTFIKGTLRTGRGSLKILGGTVEGAITAEGGGGVLTIGNNSNSVNNTQPVIKGRVINSGGQISFYDGIIKATSNNSPIPSTATTPEGYHIKYGTETIDGVTYNTACLEKD